MNMLQIPAKGGKAVFYDIALPVRCQTSFKKNI